MGNDISLFQLPSVLTSLPQTSPQLWACIRPIMSFNFSQNQKIFSARTTLKIKKETTKRDAILKCVSGGNNKMGAFDQLLCFYSQISLVHVSNNGSDVTLCFPIAPLWYYVIFNFQMILAIIRHKSSQSRERRWLQDDFLCKWVTFLKRSETVLGNHSFILLTDK